MQHSIDSIKSLITNDSLSNPKKTFEVLSAEKMKLIVELQQLATVPFPERDRTFQKLISGCYLDLMDLEDQFIRLKEPYLGYFDVAINELKVLLNLHFPGIISSCVPFAEVFETRTPNTPKIRRDKFIEVIINSEYLQKFDPPPKQPVKARPKNKNNKAGILANLFRLLRRR